MSSPRLRVLLFRSSRSPQFRQALAYARTRYPGAVIDALASEPMAQAAIADGADAVLTYRSARLGISRLPREMRARLRFAYDAIVIPLMYRDDRAAANLYRLAWWLGAEEVVVAADGDQPRAFRRGHMAGLAWRSTLPGVPDGLVTLGLLARAWGSRRLHPPARRTPMRPRVLHVIDNLGMGGAQIQLAELLNHTPADRFTVEVLALSAASTFSDHRLTRAVPVTWLDDRLTGPQRIAAVRDHCRERGYDIVHTWLFGSNIAGVAGAALANVPWIVTAIRSLSPRHYPEQRRWWHRCADAIASRVADVVTVNAEALVADHAAWAWLPARRIRVVHNGVDPRPLEDARPGARLWLRRLLMLPPNASVVGTVGRLALEKDQATFLRAVARLIRLGHDVTAVVVGDGPLRAALEQIARDERIPDGRVRWLGARTDARRIIAGLDVFVLTSRIEGFPNALLEAAMLGVPCISTKVGGVTDIVGESGGLFAPGDAETAASLIAGRLGVPTADADAATVRIHCYREFTADRLLSRWAAVYGAGEDAA